jgi:4'-phosphopantetheinyl transferase
MRPISWIVDAGAPGSDALLAEFAHPSDEERAQEFARHSRRESSRGARALLRRLLASEFGIAPSAYRIEAESHGRPFLAPVSAEMRAPMISISHSGPYLAVAAAKSGELGVDVECWKPGRDIERLAEFGFGGAEIREVKRAGATAFYRTWTIREAVAKALGQSVLDVLDSQDWEAHSETTIRDGKSWYLKTLNVIGENPDAPPTSITVAHESMPPEIHLLGVGLSVIESN